MNDKFENDRIQKLDDKINIIESRVTIIEVVVNSLKELPNTLKSIEVTMIKMQGQLELFNAKIEGTNEKIDSVANYNKSQDEEISKANKKIETIDRKGSFDIYKEIPLVFKKYWTQLIILGYLIYSKFDSFN